MWKKPTRGLDRWAVRESSVVEMVSIFLNNLNRHAIESIEMLNELANSARD